MATRTPPSKVYRGFSSSNPFDSDSDSDLNPKPSRTSSAPVMTKGNHRNPQPHYSELEGRGASSSTSSYYSSRNNYRNDFRDSGGMENQSVQELEGYAAYKAKETTQKVNDCRKIAEEIREDASKTLVNLHQQGEQITRTHQSAANIEHDLSRELHIETVESVMELERSLTSKFQAKSFWGVLEVSFLGHGSLRRRVEIKGPVLTKDDSFIRRGKYMEQRQRLGISSSPTRSRSSSQLYVSEPTSALEKVEVEKAKQDDALLDLSNLLGDLKNMAIDMGSEIERQNKALDHLDDDVEELNFRVRGANIRGRRLLGK